MFSVTHANNLFLYVMFNHISGEKVAEMYLCASMKHQEDECLRLQHGCDHEHWLSIGNLQPNVAIIFAENTWK